MRDQPLVVLRHGIVSDSTIFDRFSQRVHSDIPSAAINNVSYDWKRSVLENGLLLAAEIARLPHTRLAIVGHSMGGLIARVANLALTDPSFAKAVRDSAFTSGYGSNEIVAAERLQKISHDEKSVKCVICLATPNAGAMTNAQLTYSAYLSRKLFNAALQSVQDLTGVRLFRFLQTFSTVADCLTISGSSESRYGRGVIGSFRGIVGVSLSLPNDGVVEDASVDLRAATLPPEFDLTHHQHLRQYRNCHEVHHLNIYNSAEVARHAIDYLKQYL